MSDSRFGQKVLFCNVGWMEQYKGLSDGDSIKWGGEYVKKTGTGHEVCNFAVHGGRYYGYVQAPNDAINISRLGARDDDECIHGVTVIWVARSPLPGLGTVIVGWYENATVFRRYQYFDKGKVPPLQAKNKVSGYWIVAQRGRLLDFDSRSIEIPRGQGGIGQSNVWFADRPDSKQLVRRIIGKLVVLSSGAGTGRRRKQARAPQDPERKTRVEQMAVAICRRHYEGLGYRVKTVERENLGWDLEAARGGISLQIEVKGLSGEAVSAELTPNEYVAFSKRDLLYRLAVVVRALGKSPRLFLLRFSSDQGKWIVEGKPRRSVEVVPRESAVVRCS